MATKSSFNVIVLLPVMNEAIWIERCLTSLTNQTQEDIAILVQENCSDDGTLEIISKFAQEFQNIYLFKNSSRVDSWKNWDLLLQNAIENFDFEYLFWIGGDDYLYELDFISNLYREGKNFNLSIVSPTIVVIDGEGGKEKNTIEFSLNSNLKLLRILKYCLDWNNVNIFHSLISKDLYLKLLNISGNSHTNYVGNDWWLVLSIIRKHRIRSLKNTHFYKSQWIERRYQWSSNTKVGKSHGKMFLRIKRFIQHIFHDAIVLVKHVFRGHPIKNSLTNYEISIVLTLFVMRMLIKPPLILGNWVFSKCRWLFQKTFATNPEINRIKD
jgi:glycosyltransferase involved in cell wall biosynthesis